MNLTVCTSPDPSAAFRAVLQRISLTVGAACFLVPDMGTVADIQAEIAALHGRAFLSHRFYTFEGLAREILGSAGIDVMPVREPLKKIILSEISRARLGGSSRFAAVAEYAGFIATLSRYVEDVQGSLTTGTIHDPELAAILQGYRHHLARTGSADHEGLVERALEEGDAASFAGRFGGPMVVHGFYDLTVAQFALLKRLFGLFSRACVSLVNDPSRPELFSLPAELEWKMAGIGAKIRRIEPDESTGDNNILRCFMSSGSCPLRPGETCSVETFRGPRAEADWIAGTIRERLLEGAWSAGDVMVVARRTVREGDALVEALRRGGIPLEHPVPVQLDAHPLVRFILDACTASIHPDDTDTMKRVLSSHYTSLGPTDEGMPAGVSDERAWSCMIAPSDSPEGFAGSVRRMIDHLGLEQTLDGGGDRKTALREREVLSLFFDTLDEFVSAYTPFRRMLRGEDAVSLLRRYCGSVTIAGNASERRAVVVTDANHARYLERDIVFVTGADDASFPSAFPMFTLHDAAGEQQLRGKHGREEPLLLYMVTQGAKHLCFTFPGVDDEHGDNALSPHVRAVGNALGAECPVTYHPRVAGAAWERGAVDDRGRHEEIIRYVKHRPRRLQGILDMLGGPGHGSGRLIRDAVASYCRLREPPPIHIGRFLPDDGGATARYSVTDIERYLSCPVSYYYATVIGLSVERPVVDGMEPATRGYIIHRILAAFYSRLLDEYGTTGVTGENLAACVSLVQRCTDEVFVSAMSRLIGIHPEVIRSEKEGVKRWMTAFVHAENGYAAGSGFSPAHFEVSFGDGNGDTHPPVRLGDDGVEAEISGRIDRIDLAAGQDAVAVRVVDYKTGRVDTVKAENIVNGPDVQIPLYLVAARSIVDGSEPYDGCFYELRTLRRRPYRDNRRDITGDEWRELCRAAIQNSLSAVRGIQKGQFPRPPADVCAGYCDFRHLCRGGSPETTGD